LDFPAVFNAIAIACLRGLPAAISVLMFDEIALSELPFFNGIKISFALRACCRRGSDTFCLPFSP